MAKQLGIRQLPIFQFHHMKNFFTISSNCADISEKSQFRLSVFAHIKLPLMLNASLMEGCSSVFAYSSRPDTSPPCAA